MANLWDMFREITPEAPLLIGTVLSHTADGYSMIEMPGGGLVRAKGTLVAVNKKAFIQSGEVKSEAPDLSFFEVTI